MISILVPIYNTERYLRRCIDSVLEQNFTDWELILVDDGSPDDCPRICDKAAAEDRRIKVVHKKNGGLPSARLAGFKVVKGEYLVFLDADDWLLRDALQMLHDAITSDGGYDVVRSLVKRVTDTGEEWIEHYGKESGVLEGMGTFMSSISGDSVAPYLHSAIYKRALFSEAVFLPLIDLNISVGEDWFTNYYIAPNVERVKFIKQPTFAYFINSSSMMGGSVYGWEYYDRIEACKKRINSELGIPESNEYLAAKGLMDLRYFFFPEVGFSWRHFKQIQPNALIGVQMINEGKTFAYNPKHLRFLSCGLLYFVYTSIYRLSFFLFKLKCKSRKVIK